MDKLNELNDYLTALLNESDLELSHAENEKEYEYWSGFNTAITKVMNNLIFIKYKE